MSASSMKTIKNRIKSISSTMQITKAMELVAASKMRKASESIERSKPYFNILHENSEQIFNRICPNFVHFPTFFIPFT